MEKTGLRVRLLARIAGDWRNREQVEQTAASLEQEAGHEATYKLFKEIGKTVDIPLLIASEELAVLRERDLFGKRDSSVLSSLNAAVADFAVMKSSLQTATVPEHYQQAATTYHSKKKAHGVPADGFHEAINSHITRLGNRMSAVGISVPEKNILRQRQANMRLAKELYIDLQRNALGLEAPAKGKGLQL